MGSVWGHQANLISSPLSHPKCMHSGLDLNESPFIFDTKEGVGVQVNRDEVVLKSPTVILSNFNFNLVD